MTVRKRLTYHGYRIEIMDNHWWSFRYEWVIHPPKQMPRNLLRFKRPFTDPTSHRDPTAAMYYAKCAVNEMRNPMWSYNLDIEWRNDLPFRDKIDESFRLGASLASGETTIEQELLKTISPEALAFFEVESLREDLT